MRKTTLFLAITALLTSGAALAGGNKAEKSHALEEPDQGHKAMSVEKIDSANVIRAFNKADKDSDFQLTRAEAERIEGLKRKFSKLDEDGDGAIDYTEFRALTETSSKSS